MKIRNSTYLQFPQKFVDEESRAWNWIKQTRKNSVSEIMTERRNLWIQEHRTGNIDNNGPPLISLFCISGRSHRVLLVVLAYASGEDPILAPSNINCLSR